MESINLVDMFLDDNYSIESLLAKTQENNLNLSDLRARLIQHQQDLNQTSLELFNNSYDRFYKLSYIISCLSEPIQHLINPLQNFRDQLGGLCQNHDAYVGEINSKLGSLENTTKNKELARRLILLIKRRDRIQKQMENIDWSVRPVNRGNPVSAAAHHMMMVKHADSIEYKIKCDLLERVSIELYHLASEVRAIQPTHDELIPIKKSLESSLDTRQTQLDNWFESAFLGAIESQDETLIDLILRTYRQRDASQKLDLVWRSKVVKPYLNLSLNDTQLPDQISQIYELLNQFIQSQMKLIHAEFVARSFWQEVIESLDSLEKIYSLNEFDTFQRRHAETRAFLQKQNEYIPIGSVGVGLSENEAKTNAQRIMSKFNLKGYFNHRLSQIASSVESSLTNHPLSEMSTTGDQSHMSPQELILSQFKLKICMHIYALVTKCWSPELYIDTLELSFSQLACRIINRFADWLSKLRLSDFRITGPTAPENNRQTNFLAKQDAIMRLLIEDCDRLTVLVNKFLSGLSHEDTNLKAIRGELISESFDILDNGLSNVRSLQRLIER